MLSRCRLQLMFTRTCLLSNNQNRRFLSSASKAPSATQPLNITGPSKSLKAWESGAKAVKNTATVNNEYMEAIREVHDPSLHIKTIEDELKGTIGKALGKQGDKLMSYLRAMHDERRNYENLLQEEEMNQSKVLASVQRHNELRKECLQARWELTVHRQAVGFIVNNHKFVMETFPIGDALPEEIEQDISEESSGAA